MIFNIRNIYVPCFNFLQHQRCAYKRIEKINLKLAIVGPDFGFGRQLKEQTRKMGLDIDVIFTGFLPPTRNGLLAAYEASNIIILPAYSEIFGHVLLEAGAFEKPVITTFQCGLHETIKEQKMGLLVNYGDSKSLAQKILYLIENNGEAIEIGKNARKLQY